MTSPYYHAQSSARVFKVGCAENFLDVHNHLDATKIGYADARHRALRHNTFHFTHMMLWPNIHSQYQGIPLITICEQHCIEDCGGTVPTPCSWVAHFSANKSWQNTPIISATTHALNTAQKYGGKGADYLNICKFMCRYTEHAMDKNLENTKHHRLFTHHSQGIFDAEAVFGEVIINSRGKPIPTRYIAERIVKNELGLIPTVKMWLEDINPARWMSKGTHISTS